MRDLLETGDLDNIWGTLSALEVIVEELHDSEQYILEREGTSQKFLKASNASKEAKEVICAVEDIFCCALVGGYGASHKICGQKIHILDTMGYRVVVLR